MRLFWSARVKETLMIVDMINIGSRAMVASVR